MSTPQTRLSGPARNAGVLAEDVPARYGLVIVERDLHWKPAKFGEIIRRP